MPRIDPLQLLKCLSVLLAPDGGIKSPEDVARLVSLMSKFSKKLVSKCIYVQILQATSQQLLAQFMRDGGWDLVSTWIMEAAALNNGPLLEQLLELTHVSPLDLSQLQINNCPRTVKALTREAPTHRVQELATMVVEAWVRMARQGLRPQQPAGMPQMQPVASPIVTNTPVMQQAVVAPSTVQTQYVQQTQPLQTEIMQPQCIQQSVQPQSMQGQQLQQAQQLEFVAAEPMNQDVVLEEPMHFDVGTTVDQTSVNSVNEDKVDNINKNQEVVQSVEMQEVAQTETVEDLQDAGDEDEEGEGEEESGASAEENEDWDTPLGQLPVYKITIRDGKQVLAKVYTGDRPPQKANVSSSNVVLSVAKVRPETTTIAPATSKVAQELPKVEVPKKVVPKAAGRRKQQLKPSCTDAEAPLEMSETEKKKVATQEKISARMVKELAVKRQEKILREKQAKLREKLAEREAKEKERKAKVQEEKDQATLARLMGTKSLALGKIPKKSKPSEDNKKHLSPNEVKSELNRRTSEEERRKSKSSKSDSKSDSRKDDDKKSPSSSKNDHRRDSSKHPSSKSSNITSNGSATPSSSSSSIIHKPKIKTFMSKPRSTGLEEQPPPPPARGQSKKDKDKRSMLSLSKKRSPPPAGKDQTPPEKRPKPSIEEEVKKEDVKKAVPSRSKPKPAIHLLQESDFFMGALTAASRPEPRKRKRRISSSKDDAPAVKSEPGAKEKTEAFNADGPESPSQSPKERKSMSPTALARPSFQFYTDTLDTSTRSETNAEEQREPTPSDRTPSPSGGEGEDESKTSSNEGSTRGVLVLHRSIDRVKKSVRFREEEDLVSILYFELDETERVNVTKTFGDMRMLDLEHERELMQNAKKNASLEVQEERNLWRPLIPIDCPAQLVEPGKNSKEKEIQFAREKTVLQAIYFSQSSIPDGPAEADIENHPTTDPVMIPLDDTTGNPDSVKDYTNIPWPEPKIGPPPQSSYVTLPVTFPPTTAQVMPSMGGGWRTGDGQVLASGPGEVFPVVNNFPPHAGYETGNPATYNYGYETPSGYVDGANTNYVGPPDLSNMSNGPMGPGPNNFMFPPPGPGNFRQQGPGNWGPPMGGPMNGPGPGPMGPGGPMGSGPMGPGPNDMRGGPRFRGNMGPRSGNRPNWQGPPRGGGPQRSNKGWGGGGGGGGGGNRGVCKHFRSGYCRNEDNCKFLHPGVNGPKF